MDSMQSPLSGGTNISKKKTMGETKKKMKYPGTAEEMQYKQLDGMSYGMGTGRKTKNALGY